MRIDRDQLLRLATFWLRPDFVLRVVARFQAIVGFDRAMALASSALVATIPLTIVIGAVMPNSSDAAGRLISRYGLTGDGAAAVRGAFQPASEVSTGIGVIGAFLLIISMLSFTRAVQRLLEQTWQLPPLSVRNTISGVKWLGTFVIYLILTGAVHSALDGRGEGIIAVIVLLPVTAGFLLWTGHLLSGYRITLRDLLPFALVAAALVGIYELGAAIYTPHAFNSYAARYGVIGVVFAMISTLFGLMLTIVTSAAIGREIRIELDNIAAGVRPSEDEVRKQWEIVLDGFRAELQRVRRRPRSHPPDNGHEQLEADATQREQR